MPSGLTGGRWLVVGIAFVLLLGALFTPAGLAKSHGSGAAAAVHVVSWDADDGHGHGHSHDDHGSAATGGHAHHTGDHSHDHAHALPVAPRGVIGAAAIWHLHTPHSGPSPSLDGLDRPPRA